MISPLMRDVDWLTDQVDKMVVIVGRQNDDMQKVVVTVGRTTDTTKKLAGRVGRYARPFDDEDEDEHDMWRTFQRHAL